MRRYILSVVLTLLLAAFSGLAYAQAPREFEAELAPLNASGVSGVASLTLDGDELTVSIQASGLVPEMTHPQHIHGFMASARNATCPTLEEDTDNNGLVDLEEGQPAYGPVLLPLEPFPTASDGTIDFEETYTVDPQEIGPLQNRVIVLHGMTVAGEYIATLPVACGQIRPIAQGQGQQQGQQEQEQGAEMADDTVQFEQVELRGRRGGTVGQVDLSTTARGRLILELTARGFDPDRFDVAIADNGMCRSPDFNNVGDILIDLSNVRFFQVAELMVAAEQQMGQMEEDLPNQDQDQDEEDIGQDQDQDQDEGQDQEEEEAAAMAEVEAGATAELGTGTTAGNQAQAGTTDEFIAILAGVDIQQLMDENGSALIVRDRMLTEGETQGEAGQAERRILACAVIVPPGEEVEAGAMAAVETEVTPSPEEEAEAEAEVMAETEVTLADISAFVEQFADQQVTVMGDVDRMLGNRAFQISEGGEQVTVLTQGQLRRQLEQGESLRVTGTVREFARAEIEAELGTELSDNVANQLEGEAVIIASNVRAAR